MKKRFWAALLSLAMVLTMLPTAALAADTADPPGGDAGAALPAATPDQTITVNDLAGFTGALTTISGDADKTYLIDLQADVTLTDTWDYNAKSDVTIKGNGHTIFVGGGNGIQITGGGTLTLGLSDGSDTLTITKAEGTASLNSALVTIDNSKSGGTLNMYDGVTVTGNNAVDVGSVMNDGYKPNGAGIALIGDGTAESTFNMYGGTISKNTTKAAGEAVNNNVYFTGMGAGVLIRGTKVMTGNPTHMPVFNMYGGVISENQAIPGPSSSGDRGNTGLGGGVCAYYGEFNFYGGTIRENTAKEGGGVCVYYGTLNFYGGTVQNNKATTTGKSGANGGGIYCSNSAKIYMGPQQTGAGQGQTERTVSGNVLISQGTSSSTGLGAGIYLSSVEAPILDDVTISGNQNQGGYRSGGGITLGGTQQSDTTGAVLKNCTITGNTAMMGAGFSVEGRSYGPITFENCTITDNRATGSGGAMYLYNSIRADRGGVTITIKDTVIGGSEADGNTSGSSGGAICVGNGTFTIKLENTKIIWNSTSGEGGGISLHNGTTSGTVSTIDASASGNVIANNTANGHGADVFVNGNAAKDKTVISLPDAAGMSATYQDSGEAIDGWYQDTRDNRYTPSVDGVAETIITNLGAGTALVASYKAKPTHTITVNVTNGTAAPAGPITVTEGASQTITFTPNEGYELGTVTVDGQPAQLTDGKYTFTGVKESHTIDVVYKQTYVPPPITYYYIDATAGEGGSISPSGRVPVVAGTNAVFTITPEEGYRVADVLVDGQSVGAVSSYTFSNVRANHTIQVTFIETEWVADPDDTGVSDWLVTDEHIAFLQGYGNGQFRPDGDMTRAEVAQMFYNLLRDKDVAITVTFDDVPGNRWFSKAVNTLASLGILKGVGGNRFDPDAPITRAEFTAIAMRFTSAKAETATNPYTDVSPSNWYYEAVVGANAYGWIRGYGNGQFRPNNTITRAEVTAITNRMLGRVADRAYIDAHADELPVRFTDNPASGGWAYYNIVEATNEHTYQKGSGQQESWTGLVR